MGSPLSPPGLPGSDRPDQPISPYRLDKYGYIDDPTDWRLWWEFNKDLYLRFANINTSETKTGSDDFYLGQGQRSMRIGGRASNDLIDGAIVPALLDAVKLGGSNPFAQSALVAMTKIGGEENQFQFDFITKWFLELPNGTDVMHPTAAFCLGLEGDTADIQILRDLAKDTEAGRAIVKGEKVPEDVRAYATYGLGVMAGRSEDRLVRGQVVRDLIDLLEAKYERVDKDGKKVKGDEPVSNDVQVAAMISLGLVPLHVDDSVVPCYCGKCVVPEPETSLYPQVTYLMRYFTADKEFDPFLRAHAATTLGRLVAARPAGVTERMKEGIAEVLIRALENSSQQPALVRESAVLALGLMGDADEGDIDKWIRWAVARSARAGTPLEKRFAMIALAYIGGRPGEGDEPFGAVDDVRRVLLQHLSSAKKDVKPWAGLALGVLGHSLREDGQPLDSSVDLALRSSMKTVRRGSDMGAYAIALGLRQDASAADALMERFDEIRDEDARGYAALALGLMGAREAIEPLQRVLTDGDSLPLLQTRAGVALGLLGDSTVIGQLLELAQNGPKEKAASREAAVAALGYIGDRRAIERLCEILVDKEQHSDTLRETAMVAAGFLADRTAKPWRTVFTLGCNYRAEVPSFTSGAGTGILNLN
ncbi:MAG: HEAT repeat domain-containing protein [Planctomycetota bacterium]